VTRGIALTAGAPPTHPISPPWRAGATYINGELIERPGGDAEPEAAAAAHSITQSSALPGKAQDRSSIQLE
jgi:hypothetical protein